MKKLIIFAFVLVLISSVYAASVLKDLHLNIQTTDSSGKIITGTYDFVFNISTTSDCSNVVYSNSTSLTTDSRGIISYYLRDVSLDYKSQYYLCYYRDGSLISASQIALTPYTFRAQNITLGGVEINQNLNMGNYNVTSTGHGFFKFLGSLINKITSLFVQDIQFNGTINGSGNIVTTKNISANYFLGSGKYLTDINQSAVNYWTKVGNNLSYDLGNVSVGSNTLFVDSSNGYVGIGTANPSHALDVNGNFSIKTTSILVGGTGNVDIW